MSLDERVYRIVSKIPRGKVTTYGGVGKALGDKALARAVGNSLNKNPNPVKVPCHRVIRSDRSVGGYAKGSKKKEELLRREGIEVIEGMVPENYILYFSLKN
ncbi:MAG: MGMT family protein [Candidatus Altiarchaeota archaeon]|nr:MGMT family protein [Candidatus Altiarchaeota archaeon]